MVVLLRLTTSELWSLSNRRLHMPMMVASAKAAEAIQHAERLVSAMDAMLG